VGHKEFVMQTKAKLIAKAMDRKSFDDNKDYVLKEFQNPYNRVCAPEKGSLRLNNDFFWQSL